MTETEAEPELYVPINHWYLPSPLDRGDKIGVAVSGEIYGPLVIERDAPVEVLGILLPSQQLVYRDESGRAMPAINSGASTND